MTNQLKIIDYDLATELSGGDLDFAKELIATLITSLPEHEDDLKSAHDTNDLDKLSKAAHKLGGAASYTGTLPLQQAAKALETASKCGKTTDVDTLFKQLFKEIKQVKSMKQATS